MYGTSGVIEMPPPPASPAIQSSRSWARGPPEEPGPWSEKRLLESGIHKMLYVCYIWVYVPICCLYLHIYIYIYIIYIRHRAFSTWSVF